MCIRNFFLTLRTVHEKVSSKIEFVDSGLILVESGFGSGEKSTGSGGPKINGSDRIRILIPGNKIVLYGLGNYRDIFYFHIASRWGKNKDFHLFKKKLRFLIFHISFP